MDTFIDKLAQKFTAQEIIRANSAAEAKENRKLKEQVENYENLLQQMKQLNLKNLESADEVRRMLQESSDTIKTTIETAAQAIKPIESEEPQHIDELFSQMDESLHKENVKVYRNVQAVVNEQTETIKSKLDEMSQKQTTESKKGHTFGMVMSILIFIAVLADIALQIMRIMGIL